MSHQIYDMGEQIYLNNMTGKRIISLSATLCHSVPPIFCAFLNTFSKRNCVKGYFSWTRQITTFHQAKRQYWNSCGPPFAILMHFSVFGQLLLPPFSAFISICLSPLLFFFYLKLGGFEFRFVWTICIFNPLISLSGIVIFWVTLLTNFVSVLEFRGVAWEWQTQTVQTE